MNSTSDQLLNAALALPAGERLEFAEALVASLRPEDRPPFDESWREVIRRRAAEITSGQVASIPWSDVKRQGARSSVNKVRFHPEAQSEYEAAIAWYHGRSQRTASRFEAEVERVCDVITANPEFYSRYDEQTRFALLQRFLYSLIYLIDQSTIHIVAVAHASRAPGYWQGRK